MSGAWTYGARETGVMQGLEKHNLTRGTDAPAAFLIQLQRNFLRAFLVECAFVTHQLLPKVLKFQPDTTTNIASSPEKNICCLINNTLLVKVLQDLNFETKIVGIHQQLTKIYYFKNENMKFYGSNFESLLSTFFAGLFSLNVCVYMLNFSILRKDKNIRGSFHWLAIYMYDTEKIEFKFSQWRGHLIKLTEKTAQGFL